MKTEKHLLFREIENVRLYWNGNAWSDHRRNAKLLGSHGEAVHLAQEMQGKSQIIAHPYPASKLPN